MGRTLLACVVTALVVGGGVATAQTIITSRHIQNNTIKSEDLRDRAIRSPDIKKSAITRDRLSKNVRALLTQGPGSGVRIVSETTINDSENWKSIRAYCPTGTTVLGGGGVVSSLNQFAGVLSGSFPINDDNGSSWFGSAQEPPGTSDSVVWSLVVYAVCGETSS
jgi:hypothetical protein